MRCPGPQALWIDHNCKCAAGTESVDSACMVKTNNLILKPIAVPLAISQLYLSKTGRSSLNFAVKTVLHCITRKGARTLEIVPHPK